MLVPIWCYCLQLFGNKITYLYLFQLPFTFSEKDNGYNSHEGFGNNNWCINSILLHSHPGGKKPGKRGRGVEGKMIGLAMKALRNWGTAGVLCCPRISQRHILWFHSSRDGYWAHTREASSQPTWPTISTSSLSDSIGALVRHEVCFSTGFYSMQCRLIRRLYPR